MCGGNSHWGSTLVPWIDMANHAPSPNADYSWDAARGRFTLSAKRDLVKGEQILVDYGIADNRYV
jgi:hypothetical protein